MPYLISRFLHFQYVLTAALSHYQSMRHVFPTGHEEESQGEKASFRRRGPNLSVGCSFRNCLVNPPHRHIPPKVGNFRSFPTCGAQASMDGSESVTKPPTSMPRSATSSTICISL